MDLENESSLLNELIKIIPKNSPITSFKSNSLLNKSNDNDSNQISNHSIEKQNKNQERSRNKNYTLFLNSLSSSKNAFGLKPNFQIQSNKFPTIKKKFLFNNNIENKNINLKKLINQTNIKGRNIPQPLGGDILPMISQSPSSKSNLSLTKISPIQIINDVEDFQNSVNKKKFFPFKLTNEKQSVNNNYIYFQKEKYKKLKLKSLDNSKLINQSINNSNIENISDININFLSRSKDGNNPLFTPNHNSNNNSPTFKKFNDNRNKMKCFSIKKLFNTSSFILNGNNNNLNEGLNANPQIVNISIGNISINENNNNFNINNKNNQNIKNKNNEKNIVRPKSCESLINMKNIKDVCIRNSVDESRYPKISNNEMKLYNIEPKIIGNKENEKDENKKIRSREKIERNKSDESFENRENANKVRDNIVIIDDEENEKTESKEIEKPPKNNIILATLSKQLKIKDSDVNIIINNIKKKMSYDSNENINKIEKEKNNIILQNEDKKNYREARTMKSKTKKSKHFLKMNFKDSYFYHENNANISNIYYAYIYEQNNTCNKSDKFLENLNNRISKVYISKIKDELISSKMSLISFNKNKSDKKYSKKKSFIRSNSLRDSTRNNIINFNASTLDNYLKQNNSFFNDNFELYKSLINLKKICGTNRIIAKYLNTNYEFEEIDLKHILKRTCKKSISFNPAEFKKIHQSLIKYKTIQGIDKSKNNGFFKLLKSEVFKYDNFFYSKFTDENLIYIHNLILRTHINSSKIQNFFDENKIKNKNLKAIKQIDTSNLLSKEVRYSFCKINSLTPNGEDGTLIRRRGGLMNFTPLNFDVKPIKKSLSKKITNQQLSVLGQKSFFVNNEKKKIVEKKDDIPFIFQINEIKTDGKKGQYLLNNFKTIEDLYWGLCFLLIEKDFDLFMLKLEELKNVIDINYQLFDGNTFLIISVQEGNAKVAQFLCQKKCDINIQNIHGNTALHYAIGNLFFDIVDILISFGAREDILNKKGFNPWDCVENKIE